jgi:hypothetical protein
MRVLAVGLGVGLVAIISPAHAADQVINAASCCATVSAEQWRAMAEYAFTKREYNIEENTPSLVVGELEDKRVEVVIEPGKVVVRWKEGYSGRNDLWIRNVKTDMLWRMVE